MVCLSPGVAVDEFYSMPGLHDSQSVPIEHSSRRIKPPAHPLPTDFLLLPAVPAID